MIEGGCDSVRATSRFIRTWSKPREGNHSIRLIKSFMEIPRKIEGLYALMYPDVSVPMELILSRLSDIRKANLLLSDFSSTSTEND
jgi:hypothetical protein